MDNGEFLIRSSVRSGDKQEFSFALGAQSQLPASLVRTPFRSRNESPPPPPSANDDGLIVVADDDGHVVNTALKVSWPDNKRMKRSEGEGSQEDPIGVNADRTVVETTDLIDALEPALQEEMEQNTEMKTSKKVAMTKIPSNIRELFATGLLEGLPVKYVTATAKQTGLKGVIRGNCILCHCASCRGSTAISAYKFEQHAGSAKKHPADFILLENGNTIKAVLEACKASPLGMLESSIKYAVSMANPKKPIVCQKCNEPVSTTDTGKFATLCDSCLTRDQHQATPILVDRNDDNPRLSVTSDFSDSKAKNKSSQKVHFRKLTGKNLGLHKLVFMGGILPQGTEVGYFVCKKRKLQGSIKDSGILCSCCSSVVSPSRFESHAGEAHRRKPYESIKISRFESHASESQRCKPYESIKISNGMSLHELALLLSKDGNLSASDNDDLCSICADGGDLLLCDFCPRAFHIGCVRLPIIPKGKWRCRYCEKIIRKEKLVKLNGNAIPAGRDSGANPIEQIYKPSIRIVETDGKITEGCVFCRRGDFSKEFGPRTVLFCDQCGREYHVGCLKDYKLCNLEGIPKGDWFCSTDCSRIHAALKDLSLPNEAQLHDLDFDMLKRGGKDLDKHVNVDIRWRLLNGKNVSPDTNSLFEEAISILHESFGAIVESESGRDLIPSMVYGKSTTTQELEGMHCAVLTVDSSVVSTVILRVLGRQVAELPLVATHTASQKLGYFQLLFARIERLLASLKVKHLVLPAAKEAESIWTHKFGFKRVYPQQLREYTGGVNTMIFEGTSMLHKLVPKDPVSIEGCHGS